MTQEPRYLTATQVAERLQVTAETAREWARTGKIEAIQTPSGHYRYPVEAVEAIERKPVAAGGRS